MASTFKPSSMLVGSAADFAWQGEGAADGVFEGRGLRLDTIILVRWVGIGGQVLALIAAGAMFGIRASLLFCAALVALSAAVNVGVSLVGRRGRLTTTLEAFAQFGFDLLQLAALLYFTGGVNNPFILLLIAPVTLAAFSLPWRPAALLACIAIVLVAALAVWSWLPPWIQPGMIEPPLTYRVGVAVAVASGVAFTAGYAWLAARQAARMELALHVTQAVLAREQQLSALGGLAAAAAHELGTPLATISVVAKELAREGPEAVREDARLLLSQTERCREILRRLTEAPDAGDAVHARMSLLQLLNEVIEPHMDAPVRVEAVVAGAPGVPAPYIRRMPEVLRAMTSLVDNAVDFAASDVLVTARFDQDTVSMEVRDDGPGFAPDILGKLGQPYITSRPSGEGSRTQHSGMGLGFFIAKTLLERTGAKLEFKNGKGGGAIVAARWPRQGVEAPDQLN